MADEILQVPTPVEANAESTRPDPKEIQTCCYIDVAAAEDALPPLILLQSEEAAPKSHFDLAAANAALPPLAPPENEAQAAAFTPENRHQPPKLETLGHDLLKCILDYIPHKTHLRACLRMNKEFASLIVPRLYKSLGITISKSTHSRYACLLAGSHSGLQHVKKVNMWPKASGEVPESAHAWVKTFLGRLHEGQLTSFRWGCDWTMPLDLLQYVRQTQPKVERFQLNGLKVPGVGSIHVTLVEQLDAARFDQLTLLELTPYNANDALAGSKALEKFSTIDALFVSGLFWSEGDPYREDTEEGEPDEGSDPAVQDKLTTTLFEHRHKVIPRTLKTKWSGLSTLWISDINMRYCRDTWFAYLHLVNLSYLHIQYCPNADVFLTQLMRTEPPQLRDFTLLHNVQGNTPDRIVVELEEFLVMTKGRLRDLDIWLRGLPAGTVLNLAPINRHQATLERLSVDIMNHIEARQIEAQKCGRTEMEKLLKGCHQLSQLAISLPSVTWKYRNGHFFKANHEFGEALDAILSNVSLTTLCILNLPLSFGLGMDHAYWFSIQPQWERIATDIFAHIREGADDPGRKTQRLDILAFGTRWRLKSLPVPRYFVECAVKCMYRTQWKAQQVSLLNLYDEDMDIDIINDNWRHEDKAYRLKEGDWSHYREDETDRDEWLAGNAQVGVHGDVADIGGTANGGAVGPVQVQVQVQIPGVGTGTGTGSGNGLLTRVTMRTTDLRSAMSTVSAFTGVEMKRGNSKSSLA